MAVGDGIVCFTHEPSLVEFVSVGIQRLRENGTWKMWKWPPTAKEFLSAAEFM